MCTIGIGHNGEETASSCAQGKAWIKNRIGMQDLDFEGPDRKAQALANAESMLNNIDSELLNDANIENYVLDGIQEEKILEDSKWDGLKGYVTSTNLPPEEVVSQ